jgi:hypothetical protein
MACLKTAPPTGEGGAGPPLPSEALGETESKALNAGQNIVSSTDTPTPIWLLFPDRASTR